MQWIHELFAGPIDIVGDVHGEIEALDNLLAALGYAPDGRHAGQRRLVFVGDLVDRGPDSPAVLERVARLVETGRAQCLLGNHELNLLKGESKPDNGWWTGDPDHADPTTRPVSAAQRPRLMAFLESLPLALVRDDVRVVHAAWHADSIEALRTAPADLDSIVELNRYYVAAMHARWRGSGLSDEYGAEWRRFGDRLTDPDWTPVFMPAKAEIDSSYQMANPVAVLTSGVEAPAAQPFWAGGKWRMTDRVRWWEHYDDAVPVIVGHYWRRISEARLHLADKFGPDLFAGIEPHHWMGRRGNVYCIDFSVGARAAQRAANAPPQVCKLAALRVPEWTVLHDDGDQHALGEPGR